MKINPYFFEQLFFQKKMQQEEEEEEYYRRRLVEFYLTHNPEKLTEVDVLLQKYKVGSVKLIFLKSSI